MISYREHDLSYQEAESRWLACIAEQGLTYQLTRYTDVAPLTYYCQVFAQGRQVAVGLGKGMTSQQAQLSAQYEALEHYLTLSHDDTLDFPHVKRSYQQLQAQALNTLVDDYWDNSFFAQVSPSHPLTWLEFYNYHDPQKKYYLPLALFNPDFFATKLNRDQLDCSDMFFYSSNTGSAIGASFDEALVHSIGELIERDSLSRFLQHVFLHKTTPVDIIEQPTMPRHLQALMAEVAAATNNELVLYNLKSDLAGFYAFGAQFLNYEKRFMPYYGHGCSINPAYAAERAILEAKQIRDANLAMTTQDFQQQMRHLSDFPALLDCARSDVLQCIEAKRVKFTAFPTPPPQWHSLNAIKKCVLSLLAKKEIYVHERQRYSNGVTHLFVLMPGLSQFCAVQGGYPARPDKL